MRIFSLSKIPKSLWFLASANSLLTISFVMVYSLSGIYLKEVVGLSELWIGIIAGSIEGLSYALKLGSGAMSDYLGKRRVLLLIGYGAVVISRPLLAFFPTPIFAITARVLERFGNSLQTTPTEAMVADIAPKHVLGSFFGLKKSMGMFGACLGGLFGMLILRYGGKDFSLVFNLAAIPAFIAFLLVFFTIQENKTQPRQKINFSNITLFPIDFWMLIFVSFIYMLARGCEIFIALHAKEHLDLNIIYIPLISLLYNAIYALISYPAGVLSDHYDPFKALSLGFIVFACAHMMLAFATSGVGFWLAIILWGMQLGILQNLLISLIAKSLPENLRGTGFGMFYLASALALSIAGILSGFLAQYVGKLSLFGLSACIALGGAFFCWKFNWLKGLIEMDPIIRTGK